MLNYERKLIYNFIRLFLKKNLHLISAVIITKNGERTIAQCVEAAKKAADEVIIVDSFSADNTVPICKTLGAKVFQQEWLGFGAQKNFGNQQASHNYILSLDADEVLTEEAIYHINQLRKAGLNGTYNIRRFNFYFGKILKYGLGNPEFVTRLFDKRICSWNNEAVHEKLIVCKEETLQVIKGGINHYSYFSIEQYIDKANVYTNLSAKKLFLKGKRCSLIKLIFSSLFVFFKSYIIKLGFLDGYHGFIIARFHAYTDFLKYIKLRTLYQKNGPEI